MKHKTFVPHQTPWTSSLGVFGLLVSLLGGGSLGRGCSVDSSGRSTLAVAGLGGSRGLLRAANSLSGCALSKKGL